MRIMTGIAVVSGFVLNASLFAHFGLPGVSPITQLVWMFMLLGMLPLLLVTLVFALARWRRYRFRSFLPFFITVASVVLVVPSVLAGSFTSDCIFRWRLPQYEAVVRDVVNGKIVVPAEYDRIEFPDRYSHLAYVTFAEKNANGILTVEFWTGGGFPVKHWGYLYRSQDSLSGWAYSWPARRKIKDHWYRFAD